ncbi:MAG: hypothetical protein CM15mP49_33050 [Actinomycetota bacterium]|nr:MAG: hypothetical protein CM15mP49_33050 [Actinomycetota bacterium]
MNLAFDHRLKLSDACKSESQIRVFTIATQFCGREFTISELRKVYETIWGAELDQETSKSSQLPALLLTLEEICSSQTAAGQRNCIRLGNETF